MQYYTSFLFVAVLFQVVTSLGPLIGGADGIYRGPKLGNLGAKASFGGTGNLIGEKAGNLISGAEGFLGNPTGPLKSFIHGHSSDENLSSSSSSSEGDSSSSSSSSEEYNPQRNYYEKKTNGRGIDKQSGIGSRSGIHLILNDILGLTPVVCKISYIGEAAIETMGAAQLGWQRGLEKLDRDFVNYITVHFVLPAVNTVRHGHLGVVKFVTDVHIRINRLIFDAIGEGYRLTKAPIREILACTRD